MQRKKATFLDRKTRVETRLHMDMAFVGGFYGIYMILRFHHFASAQTINLIDLVHTALTGQWRDALLCLGAAVLFFIATAVCTWLPKHTRFDRRWFSLGVDAVCAVLLALLPEESSGYLCLYPSFFAMGAQWGGFSGAQGFACSTIFSTNNLRQFTIAWTELKLNGDGNFRPRMRFFGFTLLFFHLGAAAGTLLYLATGRAAMVFCLLPIALAAVTLLRWKRTAEN